ncbi:MAG: hypothetical protein ACRCTC_02270 [Cetobacterium sp.]
MIIDSLTSTKVYVEKKGLVTIIGNSSTNNLGLLEVDSNNNKLISNIDSGDTPLYRLSEYNGAGGLMLYNPTTKSIQIAHRGDFLNVGIDFEKGTRYHVGAKLLKATKHRGRVFEIQLARLIVFKVFMDGREIRHYEKTDNSITVIGNDGLMVDDFSELVIYAYEDTRLFDDTFVGTRKENQSLTPKEFAISSSNSFEIEYYQYERVLDLESFKDETYFDEFKGIAVDCFESTSISQSVSKTMYRGGFRFANNTRLNSIDNTADFNVFGASGLVDFVQYVGNEEFRIIFLNMEYGRFILLNNCIIDNGVGIVLEKEKNTKKFTLSCGNYIDINMSGEDGYGKKRYGRSIYGSGIWVYNSHKIGGLE